MSDTTWRHFRHIRSALEATVKFPWLVYTFWHFAGFGPIEAFYKAIWLVGLQWDIAVRGWDKATNNTRADGGR